MTDAEQKLWYRLRAERLEGWKFRRQVPIGSFVADFVCERARLVIEVDGGQHAEHEQYDAARTEALREQGYRVIRFWNGDVLANLEGVLEAIVAELR
jgi:very-short-patch-repair endonuclease